MHREQLGQRVDRVVAGDTAANFDAQAHASVFIDDVQQSNRASIDRRRMHEVPSPNVVREASRDNVARVSFIS